MTTANAKIDANAVAAGVSTAPAADLWPPQTPEEYLAVADRWFAAGDFYAGSNLLYYSAVTALSQLAKIYGQPLRDWDEMKAFAGWLDEKHGGGGWLARDLMAARNFHDNAKYRYMPPDDIDFIQPLVRELIATLLSYRQKAARYG